MRSYSPLDTIWHAACSASTAHDNHMWHLAMHACISQRAQELREEVPSCLLHATGTKGMAKSLEEIKLLEERAAALAAEADEAEADHVSEGDVMTRCSPTFHLCHMHHTGLLAMHRQHAAHSTAAVSMPAECGMRATSATGHALPGRVAPRLAHVSAAPQSVCRNGGVPREGEGVWKGCRVQAREGGGAAAGGDARAAAADAAGCGGARPAGSAGSGAPWLAPQPTAPCRPERACAWPRCVWALPFMAACIAPALSCLWLRWGSEALLLIGQEARARARSPVGQGPREGAYSPRGVR